MSVTLHLKQSNIASASHAWAHCTSRKIDGNFLWADFYAVPSSCGQLVSAVLLSVRSAACRLETPSLGQIFRKTLPMASGPCTVQALVQLEETRIADGNHWALSGAKQLFGSANDRPLMGKDGRPTTAARSVESNRGSFQLLWLRRRRPAAATSDTGTSVSGDLRPRFLSPDSLPFRTRHAPNARLRLPLLA